MSTVTTPRQPAPAPPLEDVGSVPFLRLVGIELRKAVDTRAGMWLIIVMSAISLVVVGAYAIWGPDGEQSFGVLLGLTTLPLAILLPIVGIMLATQEWSTRTGLVTFTLEPRRGRVVVAKLLASFLLGLLVMVAAFAAAGLVTALTGGEWTLVDVSAWGLVLVVAVYVLQGAGFGLAFLNTPFAIVASLVLPTAWSIATSLITRLTDVAPWLDLDRTTTPLRQGEMAGDDWAKLGTSVLVWVGIPIAVGAWRVLHREIK